MILSKKYRPTLIKEVIGQEKIVNSLSSSILNDNIPHSMLFFGIRGTGKTTVARVLSRSINCIHYDKPTLNPCCHCVSCKFIGEEGHLDVIEIDAASNTGVDNIREIIESSKYKPVLGKYKVFIIDEAHMLSKSAFNALLKTLEEPSLHAKFILATTEINKIPNTILSRCARYNFERVSVENITKNIFDILSKEKILAEKEAVSHIAIASEGSIRDSLTILEQAMALSLFEGKNEIKEETVKNILGVVDNQYAFSILEYLLKGSFEKILEENKKILSCGKLPLSIVHAILDAVYWISISKNNPSILRDNFWPENYKNKALSINISQITCVRLWDLLLEGYKQVKEAPIPEQALNMLFLKLCKLVQLPPIEDLLKILQRTSQKKPLNDLQEHSSQKNNSQEHNLQNNSQGGDSQTKESNIGMQQSKSYSFDSLFDLLRKKREMIFLSEIKKYVCLIECRFGMLKISFSDSCPQRFRDTFATKLEKITEMKWEIFIEKTSNLKTINEILKEEEQKKIQNIMNQDVVKDILSAFPGSKIEID